MLVDEKVKHADTLEKLLNRKDKMLSVILICNNIVNIAVSALSTVLIQKLFGNWAVSILCLAAGFAAAWLLSKLDNDKKA